VFVEVGGSEERCPLSCGGESSFEADLGWGEVVSVCGLADEGADEVVGDDVHTEFFFDHERGFAS
jgi:hypothetical protein